MMADQYQICTRCVMDTSDPEITFNEEGYCNHCIDFYATTSKKMLGGKEGEKEMKRVLDRVKADGKGKEFDCIIGVSGGVDSSFVMYLAKKHGLRPLAVHMDNGWNSEIAVQNIKNICQQLGVEYQSYVLDWLEFKDIQLSILKSGIVEVEMPTDCAIPGALNRIAVENDVKYIISGGNIATEGILPEKWFYNAKDKTLLKTIQKRFGTKKMKHFPTYGFLEEIYYKIVKGIKMVYILNYMPFDKDDAMELLKKEFGWRYYGGKHYESKFTGFVQSYIQPVKFNVDYRRATCSTQICAGTMTREEAIDILKKPSYNPETLESEKEYICKKLGISVAEFNDIMAAPPNSYKNYPNDEKITNFIYDWYRKLYPKGRL